MIPFEMLFATEGQLVTEKGNPPEDEECPHGFICPHGEDPDSCFWCREDELAENHMRAEAEWDYEDEPL